MVTVRLPEKLEREIERLARTGNKTKSDIVKEALHRFVNDSKQRQSPYELGKDLFEIAKDADPDLSTTYKERLRKRLNEKHAH